MFYLVSSLLRNREHLVLLCILVKMWYIWLSVCFPWTLYTFMRIISAYSENGEKDEELKLKLVNFLLVNEQHMLDSFQDHCSNYFLSRHFLLESMRMLMKCINTQSLKWKAEINPACSLFSPFLFIVLYIGLIHELGGVLTFLSSLNLVLVTKMSWYCYVLEIVPSTDKLPLSLDFVPLPFFFILLCFCNSPVLF